MLRILSSPFFLLSSLRQPCEYLPNRGDRLAFSFLFAASALPRLDFLPRLQAAAQEQQAIESTSE